MSADTTPSATVTRKPDDDVGKPGSPPVGGGRQTPEQAAITERGQGGRSDADRSRDRPDTGNAGRDPTPIGGSSGGHSDQQSASGGKIAAGQYDVEKDRE